MGAPTSQTSGVRVKLGEQMVTISREFEGDSTALLRALPTIEDIATDFRVAERAKRRLMRIAEWAGLRRRREALRRFAEFELLQGDVVRHLQTGSEFGLDGTNWCTCPDSQLYCKPLWRAMNELRCGGPPRCIHSMIREFERDFAATNCSVYADACDFTPIGVGSRWISNDNEPELRFRSRKEMCSYLERIGANDGR